MGLYQSIAASCDCFDAVTPTSDVPSVCGDHYPLEKIKMKMNKRILGVAIATASLVSLAVPAGYAASTPQSAARIAHALTPLPGCAVTLTPKVGETAGRVCLVPETAAMRAAVAPDASVAGCQADVYGNGPYGSTAWQNGWGLCLAGGTGNYYIPTAYNDQASSWDSCAGGIFYANQPGTSPSAAFPANSAGNFPLGSVANDSLSSAYITAAAC